MSNDKLKPEQVEEWYSIILAIVEEHMKCHPEKHYDEQYKSIPGYLHHIKLKMVELSIENRERDAVIEKLNVFYTIHDRLCSARATNRADDCTCGLAKLEAEIAKLRGSE